MPKSFILGRHICIHIVRRACRCDGTEERRCRKADIQWLQELATRQREESFASHIGKLTGAKHDAALKWLWSFSFAGKEHRMTEKDCESCPPF